MSLLKSIATTVNKMIDTYQKKQVMRALMELSNAQLDDIGISRFELSRGLKAYPWRGEVVQPKQSSQSAQVLRFKRPMAAPSTPITGSAANATDTQQAA